jgi:hypothetical protein
VADVTYTTSASTKSTSGSISVLLSPGAFVILQVAKRQARTSHDVSRARYLPGQILREINKYSKVINSNNM